MAPNHIHPALPCFHSFLCWKSRKYKSDGSLELHPQVSFNLCVGANVWLHYVTVHVCGGQQQGSFLRCPPPYFFFRQYLSVLWGYPTRLSWLTSETLGSSNLHLPNAEIIGINLLSWMEPCTFLLLTHKSAETTRDIWTAWTTKHTSQPNYSSQIGPIPAHHSLDLLGCKPYQGRVFESLSLHSLHEIWSLTRGVTVLVWVFILFCYFWGRIWTLKPHIDLNLLIFCPHSPRAGITGLCHHMQIVGSW